MSRKEVLAQKLSLVRSLATERKRERKTQRLEKLLRISDATATNYLKELVSQGKLISHGTTRNRFYTPKV